MSNVIDYIKQYGIYDFNQKQYNSVDGLILSQLSYLKFDGIVPQVGEDKEAIRLKDIRDHENYSMLFSDERYADNNKAFFETLADSRRFGEILLNHYINLVSRRWEMQFSAICCELSNKVTHVIYRGTDESMIGWKEDFNMAFMTPIPAQTKSVDYINYVAERIQGDIYVAGHSKGGNLAVYAAMKCPNQVQDRIVRIESYDGPGFTKKALEHNDFSKISDRIMKYVPHSSVVGMLLQNQEDYKVVAAKKIGILQHDPFNWVVSDGDFVYMDDVREFYRFQNNTVNEWAQGTDPEDMRIFGNQIFDIILESGVDNLNDFKGNYASILKKFIVAVDSIDSEKKEVMKTVAKNLVDVFIETAKVQAGILVSGESDKRDKRNI